MSDDGSVCSHRSRWADKFDGATGKWVCTECAKAFNNVDALRKHSNRAHPVAKDKVVFTTVVRDSNTSKWKCPHCPDGSFHATQSSFRKHVARRHPAMPGMALKEATPSDGTKAPLAMGPPKSKVVVPIPQKTGVLAAMTRLAGYDVTPELNVCSKKEGELRCARTKTLALAAEAVLVGRKRPARTLPDDVADRKRAKFGDGADKDEKQNPVKRRDLPRTTNAPKETSRAAKPASEVVSVVASKLLRQPVVVIDEPARPRKVVVPTIRSESKHRDKTPDEGLEDEPACTIALAPVASTRTVSLDTLVQWSVDTEPTSDMESMLRRALRPVGQETAHPPRTVIVGGKNDSHDHHDEPHDVSCTSLVGFGGQFDVVPGNSVCG